MSMRALSVILLGTAGACCWQMATAADLVLDPGVIVDPNAQLPAVSGINGKWEFDPGLLTGGGLVRAAGSVSIPLGDRFGVQGDMMGTWTSPNGFSYSGALHAFTRDPERYLAGLTGGKTLSECGRMGSVAAAEVISHYGARPETDLRKLMQA